VSVVFDEVASILPFGVHLSLDGGRHYFDFQLSVFWVRLITANRLRIYLRECNFERAQGMWKLNLERQRKDKTFLSLDSRVECMAAASCVRSLLISSVDGCGLPNLGSVAKAMVRHDTPHCGPVDFTPKAMMWSGLEGHGRPHAVTKFCR
jgi:hypothetical protein